MMKNLRILIVLVLSVVASQMLLAVTLPGTSYTPYTSGGEGYSATENVVGSGSLIKGSYLEQLGVTNYSECTNLTTFAACEQCCSNLVIKCYESGKPMSECEALSSGCNNECGRSLPLDAPLWFMLALAAVGAVVSLMVCARRVSQAS